MVFALGLPFRTHYRRCFALRAIAHPSVSLPQPLRFAFGCRKIRYWMLLKGKHRDKNNNKDFFVGASETQRNNMVAAGICIDLFLKVSHFVVGVDYFPGKTPENGLKRDSKPFLGGKTRAMKISNNQLADKPNTRSNDLKNQFTVGDLMAAHDSGYGCIHRHQRF
jgi:hypothetical protein